VPRALRTDNSVPFASAHALYGLSRLAVWWLRVGIAIERIRPPATCSSSRPASMPSRPATTGSGPTKRSPRRWPASLATTIDELAFAGSGVGENPLGMRNWVGAPATAIAGPITLDVIATMIGNLEARGATPSAIFLSPANWTALLGLTDDNGAFLLVPNPSDSSPRRLFGIPVYVSMHVGDDWAAVADMSQIVFGRREEIQIAYDDGGRVLRGRSDCRAGDRAV
jgi:hypothetical protein